MYDFNPDPVPPVFAVQADTGTGKTRQWCKTVAAPLVAAGQHPVLAVPRHRLGDEIVSLLTETGSTARVYRGRNADDPEAPGEKMCRELERVALIGEALGSVSTSACKNRDNKCPAFEMCGYQRQRLQQPDVWVIPHQLLFHERPDFILAPAALGIDESLWGASLRGLDKPVKLWLRSLVEDRYVPGDIPGTADLVEISGRIHRVLTREGSGHIRSAALLDARITLDDLCGARGLEWRRKRGTSAVYPGMPIEEVKQICRGLVDHNQEVKRLVKFWELVSRTIEGDHERSPWLELRTDEPIRITTTSTEPAVRMAWREDIHPSWQAPTTVMDATLPEPIVKMFFPDMEHPIRISVQTPHARVRQIIDRPMSATMMIPSGAANERTNRTRENNVERLRYFIEVRAADIYPGRVLVISQLGVETILLQSTLPENVEFRHFNDIAGENAWNEIALLIVVGRTEPPPRDIESIARILFGAEIDEIPANEKGEVRYRRVKRGVRMRDGRVAGIEGSQHPDQRAEAVRWAICEAGLLQAIGRARAINRTAANPVQIDILTNVVLPIVTDEMTSWDLIQPADAEIMAARGAVPIPYGHMASAYPDLFPSEDGARKAMERENAGAPLEEYLVRLRPEFLVIDYRVSARGPISTLLFDQQRVDPIMWLNEHVGGKVRVLGKPRRRTRWSFLEFLKAQARADTPEGDFIEDTLRLEKPVYRRWVSSLPDEQTRQEVEDFVTSVQHHLGRGIALSSDTVDPITVARTVWVRYLLS
jgi:putative DNA primase/helicase